MKLPSITQAAASARDAFVRFPLVILDAAIGTICLLILIDYQGPSGPTVLFPITYGAALGIPLLSGLALVAEKRKWSRVLSLGLQSAGILALVLYALTVPLDLSGAPEMHIFRLFMLILGAVLFIFAAPYIGHESELGYWNYCKTLCLRIITAAVYTVVLWIGLAVALMALDKLFGVTIPVRRYPELWVFLNGIFSTWFILAGVPEDLDALDSETGYPKALKIFSQYILFPLVLVYLVILYAYLGKILLAWDWPQGWVSSLILGFIAMGFASLLLLHPVIDRTENAWIRKAARWFYVIIIPLTVMLFLAVWQRVGQYGITEVRYLGLATVVWLCVVTPYFLFSRKKKILFLASSLCVIVFAIAVGPWGMFAVSERSQVNRLEKLLVDNHILAGNRVQAKHEGVLPSEQAKEISSILIYLSHMHGYDAIQPWFTESLKRDGTENPEAPKDPAEVTRLMGVNFIPSWENAPAGIMTLTVDRDAALEIAGYDRLLRDVHGFPSAEKREFKEQGMTVRIGKDDVGTMIVTRSREKETVDSLAIDLKPLADSLAAEYGRGFIDKIPPAKMAIAATGKTMTVKVFFSSIRMQRHEGKNKVQFFDAVIATREGVQE